MAKFFTLAEAEALLPVVAPRLREIQTLRGELAECEERAAELQLRAMGNGHSHGNAAQSLRDDIARLQATIREHLSFFAAEGILVKDLDTGLIDFPTLRDGHEVYLCWQLGEEHIAWWHEIEAGFGGRQRLED